jgi:hypothetical protein
LASTATRGSGRGIGGTETRPAPNVPRVGPLLPLLRELRTDTERGVEPQEERDSLPDTERREPEEREPLVREEACDDAEDEPRPETVPGAAPDGADGADGVEPLLLLPADAGAKPHLSQDSSPPPAAANVPSQPKRPHVIPTLLPPDDARARPAPAPPPP